MSLLKIAVGARIYEISCENDEQKAYIDTLAHELNKRVNDTMTSMNSRDDSLVLVMAALFMLDEIKTLKAPDQAQTQAQTQAEEALPAAVEEVIIKRFSEGEVDDIVCRVISILRAKLQLAITTDVLL